MANVTVSPNMNLPIPNPSIDPGPDYANNISACLGSGGGGIDGHNHTAGNGVQIPPAGININTDLPFNINNATILRSVRFSPQTVPLSGASDIGCLYESGVDLYYNDGSGNQVRITQSGGVAGSPGSISNLTSPASAAYVAADETFVWQSAANTPANMDAASYILRNLVANSKGLTLNPPSSMAANYSLTLPPIPGANSFLTIDTSGNITGSINTSGGIVSSNLASGAVAQANLALRSTGTSVGAGGVALSADVDDVINSTSPIAVPGLSVTIVTTGRPVLVQLVNPASLSTPGQISLFSTTTTTAISATVAFFRGSTQLTNCVVSTNGVSGAQGIAYPPNGFSLLDQVAAGTYTYTVQCANGSSATNTIFSCALMAYEI